MKNQRGVFGVITGSVLGATLTVLSFSFDAGYIVMSQGELQNAADSASLAAITKLPVTDDEAKSIAKDFARQHVAGGKTVEVLDENVELGRYDFEGRSFQPGAFPINSSRVKAPRNDSVSAGELTLFFANLFGIQQVALEQAAVAVVDPRVVGVQAGNRLIPYSVQEDLVDADGDGNFDIGNMLNILLRNGADLGNFGFLNLNGGNLGTDELNEFILNGYNQDFVIPESGHLPVAGDTGIRGQSLLDAFEQLYYDFENKEGAIVFMPVHRTWAGPGANSVFDIVDIVALKIEQVHLIGNIHARFIRAQITSEVSSGLIVREGAATNNSLQKLRLVE